jgi:Fe2+ transport system protein FeoA
MPGRLSDGERLRHGHLPLVRLRVSSRIEDREPPIEPGPPPPASSGDGIARMTTSLVACTPGDRVIVGAIDAPPARIDRLAAVGILPGVELYVQQTRPVVVIECDETVLALEREIAAQVVVVFAPADVADR